jgi:hypothetical protein
VNFEVCGTAADHLAAVRCGIAQPDNVPHFICSLLYQSITDNYPIYDDSLATSE